MTGGFLQFVSLFDALDRTTSTNGKRAALEAYFRTVTPADAVWAIFFLTGRRLRRLVGARNLRDWASEHTALPPWLIEESYHAVGDLAETLAILCARGGGGSPSAVLSVPFRAIGAPPPLNNTDGLSGPQNQ